MGLSLCTGRYWPFVFEYKKSSASAPSLTHTSSLSRLCLRSARVHNSASAGIVLDQQNVDHAGEVQSIDLLRYW